MTTPPISFAALLNAAYAQTEMAVTVADEDRIPVRVITYTALDRILKDHLSTLDLTTDAQVLEKEIIELLATSYPAKHEETIGQIMSLVLRFSIKQLDRTLDQTEERTREQCADHIMLALRRKKNLSRLGRLSPWAPPTRDWIEGATWAETVVRNELVPR